ncbi:secreted RxLR effector protein 161-like [Primulina tabacum]|uniref:secreted RxLR effector protein 161-like n=1 Tax=Primulina tabacum TaxID=48773 RepID=UPI003F5A7FB6
MEMETVDETYYKQLVGSLMYLIATRPDTMFVTCLISRYMAKPMEIHLQAAKRALRYLKGTVNYGIHYRKGGDGGLLAFTDNDYAGDMEDMKRTYGYVFLMSSSVVSWCSKNHPIGTLSTTEAEFVATVVCSCQGVWMKRILKELGHFDGDCITVMNLTKERTIELVHCGSQDQVEDIMTKPLKLEVFRKLQKLLGIPTGTRWWLAGLQLEKQQKRRQFDDAPVCVTHGGEDDDCGREGCAA